MKKSIKILSVLLLVVLFTTMLVPNVFADLSDPLNYDDVTLSADTSTKAYSATKKAIDVGIGIIQTVGLGIAVIMLVVLAVKYISAAPSDKAEIKKHAVVYIVGAFVLFGATGILQIIKNFAKDATSA